MSPRFEIYLARRVAKVLDAPEQWDQPRIRGARELLAEDSHPPTCVAMSSERSIDDGGDRAVPVRAAALCASGLTVTAAEQGAFTCAMP